MVTVANELPGFKIVRSISMVRGIVVRTAGIVGNVTAMLQSISIGGKDVGTMVQLCEKARGDALLLMMQNAAQMRANAILLTAA